MKSVFLSSLLVPTLLAVAKELPKNEELAAEKYDNGLVHEKIMMNKHASWDRQREEGQMNSTQYPALGYVPCIGSLATAVAGDPNNTFQCTSMDLYSFLPHTSLGSFAGEGSSSWGWTSDDGREFVAIGQADGTAFAEITSSGQLVYVGRLPQNGLRSIWREIRGYKNYMLIGSEAYGHNIQIFDMTKLLTLDPANPKNFSTSLDITALFNDLPAGRSHNVHVNEELGYAVAVGAAPRYGACGSGLIYINLDDITKPYSPGCAGQDGYVHDTECLVYRGPDEKYFGRDICYGYNEDTLTIYDVTNKVGVNTSTVISRTSYTGASYTHQGSVLDKNWQEFLLLDDELDEEERAGPAADGFPVTYIWDIRSLEAPKQTGIYKSKHYSIDHNQYVHDGLSYQSNYGAGLAVLDVSSIPSDPTGAGVQEVARFDIYPEDDALPNGGVVDFVGTWSHYAGFQSGYVFINTIERGAFVVKQQGFEKRGRGKYHKAPRGRR